MPKARMISVGIFYKHLKNPIYTQTVVNTSGTFAGQTFAAADLVQPLLQQPADAQPHHRVRHQALLHPTHRDTRAR